MKKPTLIYSEDTLKSLKKRVETVSTVPGSTARRMAENLLYLSWLNKRIEKDKEIFSDFVSEVFTIIYCTGCAPQDLGQALDDIRAINDAAQVELTKVIEGVADVSRV